MLRFGLLGILLVLGVVDSPVATAAEPVILRRNQIAVTVVVSSELRTGPSLYTVDSAGKLKRPYAEIAVEQWTRHLRMLDPAAKVHVVDAEPGDVSRKLSSLRDQGTLIVLGGPQSDAEAAAAVRQVGADPESFRLKVGDGAVQIVGLSAKGALNGTLEALEQLGFRWFMPGELGLVTPSGDVFELREQTKIAVPSFRCRQLAGSVMTTFPDWALQMRNSAWSVPGSHGLPPFRGGAARTKLFAEHPEYFAEINGKRERRQACISNPDVLRLTVEATKAYFRENPDAEFIGLGPDDGGGFCECKGCRALDGGEMSPFTNRISVTDRYFRFFNQLLHEIEGEFPNKRIGTLIYSNYIMPPVKVQPDPRIVGRLALIHVCRVHSPRNPVCPEAHFYRHVAEGWRKTGMEIFNSGYWFNLADPGLPFPMLSRLKDEIPLAYELGHLGFARSTGMHWASEGPSLYLVAKLMWDHAASVDELLDDYCEKFYGPAATPMREYWTLLDSALANSDFHTGRSWDMPNFYPTAVRRRARLLLDQAAERTADTLFGRRVGANRQAFDYLEHFIAMIEDRNRHDFASSQQHLEAARKLVHSLTHDYDVPLLRTMPGSVAAAKFLEMYYAEVTEQGRQRTSGANQLVAPLSNRWEFFVDHHGVGEKMKLFNPQVTGGNWQSISSSSSWGNQGLRYYFGEAWYRQQVVVPKEFQGRPLRLWFAGVDDAARVWLNGRILGDSPGAVFDLDAHGGSLKPFETDASDAVRWGETNTLVVRVNRNKANELGSGGVIGPAMFYAAGESAGDE